MPGLGANGIAGPRRGPKQTYVSDTGSALAVPMAVARQEHEVFFDDQLAHVFDQVGHNNGGQRFGATVTAPVLPFLK